MANSDVDLLQGQHAGMVKLKISRAESDGTIKHSASVLSIDDDTLVPGLYASGPRVINFADILKYDYMPLAPTLKKVLEVFREAFGAPVEIEFAVDLTKDEDGMATFYLLQVKPLVGSGAGYSVDPDSVYDEHTVLVSKKSMGNGLLADITDVVYVEPGHFNKMATVEMAEEIDAINRIMLDENRHYVLIGPGRWGSRDRFLGIPVAWPQISNAKVIVEVGLPGYHLDASLGSHFFHNVTSMNIGYFSVNLDEDEHAVVWDKLNEQTVIRDGKFFRHVRFRKPLVIRMDGRKGMAVISVME
jgi:hypothetical protein